MVTIERLKQYLNLDQDFKDDDEILIQILNGVDEGITAYLNNPKDASLDDDEIDSIDARRDVLVLMGCAELYNNRELNINSNLKQSNVYDLLAIPMMRFSSFG